MSRSVESISVIGKLKDEYSEILTSDALRFLGDLHTTFEPRRIELLKKRIERQKALEDGFAPGFLTETENIRQSQWQVAAAPADLNDRRVEITGPVERKMMINALNSGANVFMADFEDSLSPTWSNVIEGQINLKDAINRTLSLTTAEGKSYQLNEKIATLVVRPRGWHLQEAHVVVQGQPMSASLFDFGLYFFHNASRLIENGTGPYFYLPKMENHLEARLWNDVFVFAQKQLNIPQGTIRATVLLETILAAFEMDEILYELRDHAAGLNAGRWDYIFSMIKKFRNNLAFILPDRSQITMFVPFMRAYCDLLVQTCHKRGAHAMGGMAAFIPSRKDAEVNAKAMVKVTEDKERETKAGFDGTWVAHPDLVPVAKAVFDAHLGERPNQKDVMREDAKVLSTELIQTEIANSTITHDGFVLNIDVALQYIEAWLRGNGAVAIHNLMEDAATAEISRAQLWQWLAYNVATDNGHSLTKEFYEQARDTQVKKLTSEAGSGRFKEAAEILDKLVLTKEFPEFLTLIAYEYLDHEN
jgi:malate synthase